MFSRDLANAPASRDAIDGFDAIANALDRGFDPAVHRPNSRLGDFLAIAAGWLVLGTIVVHPSLQLVAIAACAACLGTRSFARLILGPTSSPEPLRNDRAVLTA